MKKQGELSPTRPVVIVVDDDAAVRNSLRFSLEVEGFAVREYAGGTEFLKDAERPGGGCLVIDQNMPGMTGLDLVARLREGAITVPTILIASHVTPALKQRASHVGIPLVEKPLLSNVLLDRIRRAFSPANNGSE